MNPSCGPVKLRVEPTTEGYKIKAFTNGDEAGFMGLAPDRHGKPFLVVEYVIVKKHRRCGIGTKMYERALQLACEDRVRLASGHLRTEASESFWRKQAQKGRASCVSGKPATRLRPPEEGMGPSGEWECGRYAMREACPRKIDLSGRRQR
jgi:hypothetical protein